MFIPSLLYTALRFGPHSILVEMPSIDAAPSAATTERMMWFCIQEANGDRDGDINLNYPWCQDAYVAERLEGGLSRDGSR
jgi:hypothetical protein